MVGPERAHAGAAPVERPEPEAPPRAADAPAGGPERPRAPRRARVAAADDKEGRADDDRPAEANAEADEVNTAPPAASDRTDDPSSEEDPDAALGPGDETGEEGAAGLPLPEPPDPRPAEDRARDLALVVRAQAGDRAAFRALFDRHHKRVYAVAFGVLKHRQDALDVVQEAFVKVHKHLPGFQGTASFSTWLYRIVMNLAIDQLRRRRTGRVLEYDDAQLRDDAGPGEDGLMPRLLDGDPRKAVMRRELLARVEAALSELPEYHRQVILLREIEGLSYEEMAEVLDVPKGTIMSRLFHARKKLQTALAEYVDGDLQLEE